MSIEVRSNDKAADAAVNAKAEIVAQPTESNPASETENKSLAEMATASGAVEAEEKESQESESETELDGKTETEEDGKEQPNKKKGGFQRRIDKKTREAAEAKALYEQERQRSLELERRLAQIQGAGANGSDTTQDTKPKGAAQDKEPDPNDFETHAEFVKAQARWEVRQELKDRELKQQRSQLETEHQRLVREYSEKSKAFSEKHEDFDDVLEDVNDIPLSPALHDIILTSENGPELAYELAKDRDAFARLNKLSPIALAREVGRFEVKLSKASSQENPKETKITKAPPPIAPVGTGGKGSVPKSIDDPNLSQAEYERLRREQMRQKRGA